MKQLADAAALYERSDMYEKAASIYIHSANTTNPGVARKPTRQLCVPLR